jgi:hypothetical protein
MSEKAALLAQRIQPEQALMVKPNFKLYAVGLILSLWLQHLALMLGVDLVYELCIKAGLVGAQMNPFVGWDLSWKSPFEVVLYALFLGFPSLWAVVLLNWLTLWLFLALEQKINAGEKRLVISAGTAVASLVILWGLGAALGLLLDWCFVGEEVSKLAQLLSPAVFPEGIYWLLASNLIFFCIFVPFWHCFLSEWRYGAEVERGAYITLKEHEKESGNDG